jgi:two-component system sensor histidine kinase SenX3
VAESIERIRTAAEQHDVKITFDEPETSQVVFGDRRQLTSALHALLENAVVYSPRDGTVEISVRRIDTKLSPDGESTAPSVHIEVRDHGVGIPAKDLERIFERFYRVDPGRARETGGTGLGLSIVRHVAQNHGGTVLVDSREGEGSTFTLELPLNPQ